VRDARGVPQARAKPVHTARERLGLRVI
jgi:hypothetical protein